MKITSLKLWNVPLTSHEAYYMADGKTCDTVTSVIIALETDAGITGWGEVCPIPHYLPAYAGGVAPAMEELWPVLCGADPVGPEAVMAKANGWLIGHEYAKSALDIALWDITGKVANMPLYTLLGGPASGGHAALSFYHLRSTLRKWSKSPAMHRTRG
jgi:L-alanine-DL-glutamate epimerase-like enolase superfamily enzyme